MPQRVGVHRGQRAVHPRLFVGQDDVGVQVRITCAAGLVVVGDGHQTRQPLQILFAAGGVVHTGVAGVLMDVFQGLAHPRVVRVEDGLLHDVGAVGAHQTEAFRRAKREAIARGLPQGRCACGSSRRRHWCVCNPLLPVATHCYPSLPVATRCYPRNRRAAVGTAKMGGCSL